MGRSYNGVNLCIRESHLLFRALKSAGMFVSHPALGRRVKQKTTPVRFAFREEFVISDQLNDSY